MTLNDLDPRSPKRVFSEFFRNFWMHCTFIHWIATKWLKIDQDNLRMKFSASSRRPAQAGIKDNYPPKVVILPQLSRVAWKRLQIGTVMLLIITSTCDKLFRFVNTDDLERPTGWSKKRHKVYGTIILQPYITESCGFRQNVLKEILHMTKISH